MNDKIQELLGTSLKLLGERYINYVGFGLKLGEALDLAKKLRDEPYSYDRDGKEEFEIDVADLADKLSALNDEYLLNKERWGE